MIRALEAAGHQVTIASSENALAFLRVACPDTPYHALPSYGVRYPFKSMFWSMGWQGPRILHTAWRENQQVREIIEAQGIDLLISDGRFGCFHPDLHNIWLAHQLQIQLDRPQELVEEVRDLHARGVAAVEAGQAAGVLRADLPARFVVTAFMGLVRNWFEERNLIADESDPAEVARIDAAYLEAMWTVLSQGLLAPEPGQSMAADAP